MISPDVHAAALVRVYTVAAADARAEALHRLERAYTYLANGGRLDVVADDLRWALRRITTQVDRQLATAERVFSRDLAA